MRWKLSYYEEVKHDVRNAKKWYYEQQPGLEKRLAEDIKQTLNRIRQHPLHYEIKYKNVRTAFCRIFPYAIHFYHDEPGNRLVVIAVVHQHRDPGIAKDRESLS